MHTSDQVGRLLLRAAIVSQLGISNASINLGRTAAGKPFMVCNRMTKTMEDEHYPLQVMRSDENRLEFNVSHQVVCKVDRKE